MLIVELKRGGFTLTQKELDQARDYALELLAHGCVQEQTRIECYVLGTICPPNLKRGTYGDTVTVIPASYTTMLGRAQSRLFHLQHEIDKSLRERILDPEVEKALCSDELAGLFSEESSKSPADELGGFSI